MYKFQGVLWLRLGHCPFSYPICPWKYPHVVFHPIQQFPYAQPSLMWLFTLISSILTGRIQAEGVFNDRFGLAGQMIELYCSITRRPSAEVTVNKNTFLESTEALRWGWTFKFVISSLYSDKTQNYLTYKYMLVTTRPRGYHLHMGEYFI